jgi:hypothetical protein
MHKDLAGACQGRRKASFATKTAGTQSTVRSDAKFDGIFNGNDRPSVDNNLFVSFQVAIDDSSSGREESDALVRASDFLTQAAESSTAASRERAIQIAC